MPNDIETAKANIAIAVPHRREAARDAQRRASAGAIVEFAVVARNPDGSGTVGAGFQCEEFLTDLETVFPPSEDAKAEAAAACLLSKLACVQ